MLGMMTRRRPTLTHSTWQVVAGPRRRQPITLGSSCSGWLVESLACEQLGVPHKQVFACDSDKNVKKLCLRNFKVGKWVDDVHDKDHKTLPSTDVYIAGFPCQPFSSAGQNAGRHDSRASVITPIMAHIATKLPKIFVLENVVNIASKQHVRALSAMFQKLRTLTMGPHRRPKYVLHATILNSRMHGAAQQRRRVYIVGLRADSLVNEWRWPARERQPPLTSCYDRGTTGNIDRATFRTPSQRVAKRNLKDAYATMRAGGIQDPTARHFIIDVDASASRSTFTYGYCPTITATRGANRGYWGTYVRRRLTITEMMRLQGACPDRLVQNISDRPGACMPCGLSRPDGCLYVLSLCLTLRRETPKTTPFPPRPHAYPPPAWMPPAAIPAAIPAGRWGT